MYRLVHNFKCLLSLVRFEPKLAYYIVFIFRYQVMFTWASSHVGRCVSQLQCFPIQRSLLMPQVLRKKKSPATPVSDFVAATNILVHRNTRQINKGSKQTVGPVLQSGQLCSRTAVNLRQINVLLTYSEFWNGIWVN